MLEARIQITLKQTVSDPQGLIIKHALDSLGYSQLKEVRAGKLIIIKLQSDDKQKAYADIEQMCKKLLANPVIEDYQFEIREI